MKLSGSNNYLTIHLVKIINTNFETCNLAQPRLYQKIRQGNTNLYFRSSYDLLKSSSTELIFRKKYQNILMIYLFFVSGDYAIEIF